MESPSIMLMIRWKRCESQSVISINIRPRTYEVCFGPDKDGGVYSANVRLPQSTFQLRYQWNVGSQWWINRKTWEKPRKHFSEKLASKPQTSTTRLQSRLGRIIEKNVKIFFVRRLFTFRKYCISWKVATAREFDMPFSSQFNPL